MLTVLEFSTFGIVQGFWGHKPYCDHLFRISLMIKFLYLDSAKVNTEALKNPNAGF